MQIPKAVLFDFGDTIVKMKQEDYSKGIVSLAENYKIENINALREEFNMYDKEIFNISKNNPIQLPFNNYIQLFLTKNNITLPFEMKEIEMIFRRAVYSSYEYQKNVTDFVSMLESKNIERGIITNHLFSGEGIFEDIKNDISINWVISSADYAVSKPNRFLFEVALAKMSVEPHEVWFVGDMLINDIDGSQKAGMKGIWYNPEKNPNKTDIVPYLEIKDYSDIIEIINGL